MRTILLTGMKHCGKTALGKLIAEDLDFECRDLDDLTMIVAGPLWKSVREIYQTLGVEEFQLFEEKAARYFVEWVMPNVEKGGLVLSLGGGAIDNPGALAWLQDRGLVVYIHADAELLYERIMKHGRPPFLSEENPKDDFLRLYARRDTLYRKFAHLIHEVDDAAKKINAQRLLVALEKHYGR